MADFLLKVNNLNRFFGGLHAVNNVSFGVEKNRIKALIGPNGAGKTTIFKIIGGTLNAHSGHVSFKNKIITGYKPYRIAREGIASTFQTTKLFAHMTVLENVMTGRHIKSQAGFFSCMLNLPRTWKEEKIIKEKSMEILKDLGLEEFIEEKAANLPFGKQRLVEFARALAAGPELLLLDEPAAGLNIQETTELAGLLLKIRDMGITILLVEHDMSLVMDISDDIVVIDQGTYLTEGKPDDIQRNPEVIKVYLGEENA